MKQYLELLKEIKERGTYKPAARENMPGTQSLFGYQFRHNLADGFPLLTTKKIGFKGVLVELLWFLKGDTNIKFIDENNVRYMWHQDAYQFYLKMVAKISKRDGGEPPWNLVVDDPQTNVTREFTFEEFCTIIKDCTLDQLQMQYSAEYADNHLYVLGSCGYQYGKLWREWKGVNGDGEIAIVDQLKELLEGLKNSPMGRRHIITSWNPATLDDMALNACHALVQFNCRPLSFEQRLILGNRLGYINKNDAEKSLNNSNIPKYYLDCEMYQRSADSFLGLPLNTASYALLTHIISILLNMIPGDFIHTFGDVHIYDNHKEAVEQQLTRIPTELPKLNINTEFWFCEGDLGESPLSIDAFLEGLQNENFIKCLIEDDIQLSNYNPQSKIVAELSTGMKK
jgi:thymidylate synthase